MAVCRGQLLRQFGLNDVIVMESQIGGGGGGGEGFKPWQHNVRSAIDRRQQNSSPLVALIRGEKIFGIFIFEMKLPLEGSKKIPSMLLVMVRQKTV